MAAAEVPIKSMAVVKELAGAVTAQAQACNRAWIALITVAVAIILPRPDGDQLVLFINFGRVDKITFYVVGFLVLVALAIGFAVAHAQQARAHALAQTAITKLTALPPSATDIHPRDLFDMFFEGSVVRVAPLALYLRGEYQFRNSAKGAPLWLLNLSTAYYVLLKTVAFVVYYGLPLYALWRAYVSVPVTGLFVSIALKAFGGVAALALCHVTLMDLRGTWRIAGIIRRPSEPTSHPTI